MTGLSLQSVSEEQPFDNVRRGRGRKVTKLVKEKIRRIFSVSEILG
jgi:hypothetical protein